MCLEIYGIVPSVKKPSKRFNNASKFSGVSTTSSLFSRPGMLTVSDSIAECPLPELHAVSAFGARLCFFRVDHNQSIQPSFVRTHSEGTTDLALQKYWECDFRQEEGEKRFKTIAEEIKQACVALSEVSCGI
jgi:hypothetical protein